MTSDKYHKGSIRRQIYCLFNTMFSSHRRMKKDEIKNKNKHTQKQTNITGPLTRVPSSAGHYSEVIMSEMASQISGVTIVCSTVCSGTDQRKHQSSTSLVTGEFPAQRATSAENVSIWWRHHVDVHPRSPVMCKGFPCHDVTRIQFFVITHLPMYV